MNTRGSMDRNHITHEGWWERSATLENATMAIKNLTSQQMRLINIHELKLTQIKD